MVFGHCIATIMVAMDGIVSNDHCIRLSIAVLLSRGFGTEPIFKVALSDGLVEQVLVDCMLAHSCSLLSAWSISVWLSRIMHCIAARSLDAPAVRSGLIVTSVNVSSLLVGARGIVMFASQTCAVRLVSVCQDIMLWCILLQKIFFRMFL